MSYVAVSLTFLFALAVIVVVLVATVRPAVAWKAVAVTLAILVALTAVFDSIMIALGFFSYPESKLLGLFVGLAPIEDFAYPVAAAVLLPTLWTLLIEKRRKVAERRKNG